MFLLSGVSGYGQELEPPEWDDEDLEALESGDYVPGSSLIGIIARELLFSENEEPIELDPSIRNLPEEDLEEENQWITRINPQFYESYFRVRPEKFLNDPQTFLTSQELRDRDGFLNYHARDTHIDFYLYIFDSQQELPEGESVERVMAEHFEGDGAVAVVFYYLGKPERSQVEFSKLVRDSVSPEERLKVATMAVEEALEKSDPSSQLESFSIQFSMRLYWLEKVVSKGRSGVGSLVFSDLNVSEEAKTGLLERIQETPVIFYSVVVSGILIPVIFVGFFGLYYVERKRVYVFPDAQGDSLLSAPHAAGVGGVISYASVSCPPSRQRSEVPNYLQKM